jgi:hypothetical protein
MRERGTVTIWVLGLCVALMFLGGLGTDLWHAIAVRRQLSSAADGAAIAGANGIDEPALRAGQLQLDPERARALAADAIRASDLPRADATVDVEGNQVRVALEARVDFTLLGIFMRGDAFTVRVRAAARPEER